MLSTGYVYYSMLSTLIMPYMNAEAAIDASPSRIDGECCAQDRGALSNADGRFAYACLTPPQSGDQLALFD